MSDKYYMTNDAVFLPDNVHGCEDELYIIYQNTEANNGKGSFEIEVCDYITILTLYEDVNHDVEKFFELMPDYFQGKWYYSDYPSIGYRAWEESYDTADFIVGRDGDKRDEFEFIIDWAKRTYEKKNVVPEIKQRIGMWDRIDLLTEKYLEALLGMSVEPVVLQGDDLLALGKEVTEMVVAYLEKEVGAKFPAVDENY